MVHFLYHTVQGPKYGTLGRPVIYWTLIINLTDDYGQLISKSTSRNVPYLFSQKELDEESVCCQCLPSDDWDFGQRASSRRSTSESRIFSRPSSFNVDRTCEQRKDHLTLGFCLP